MGLGLGSIVNTLAGLDPRTLAQAAEEAERQRLQQRTAAAVEQSQAASQTYQNAAAAPPPNLGMAELFVPALLGNIASVLSENPVYGERGQQRIEMSRGELLKSRAQNLQALRDVWSQKAEAAQRAGDLEAEATARQKQEQIHRTYEMVAQNAEHAGRLELQERQAAAARNLETQRQAGEIASIEARGRQDRETQKVVDKARRSALAQSGLDPDTNLILRPFYVKEANRLRTSARAAKTGPQRDAAITGIIENEIQRISGESPMDFYLRLKTATHPFETQKVKGRKGKSPKPLFAPEDVVGAMQANLTAEEFALLKQRIQANSGR